MIHNARIKAARQEVCPHVGLLLSPLYALLVLGLCAQCVTCHVMCGGVVAQTVLLFPELIRPLIRVWVLQ